jgi:hypothetical protein
MNDAFTRLGKAFEGFKVQVVAAFAPAVTAGVEKVIQQLKDAGGMREVALDFAETVGFAVVTLVEGAGHFAEIIKDALNAVKAAFDGVKNFRAFLLDLQGMGMETLSDLEWFTSAREETATSRKWRDEARDMRANATRLWRESMGYAPIGADGQPQNESEIRKALRENLERMRALQQPPAPPAAPPAPMLERTDEARPMSEATGLKQVTLLQKIAKSLGMPEPEAVFELAGAAGGN